MKANRAEQPPPEEPLAWRHVKLARHLDVSPNTLRKWRDAGLIASVTIGGVRLYSAVEVARFLEEGPRRVRHLAPVVELEVEP